MTTPCRWSTLPAVRLNGSPVAHIEVDLTGLTRRLTSCGVAEVAIDRPDGPVVDALLDIGLTVVVISPNQLKNLGSRYGSAGNIKDH
jgi:transposase